jgi:hypothetical protein
VTSCQYKSLYWLDLLARSSSSEGANRSRFHVDQFALAPIVGRELDYLAI